MKEIPNLDELLNSFIDDELPPRQHTEVQRLVAHDEKIARRLEQLQQCKVLLGSLPVEEAPPQLLQDVKDSLARRTILSEASAAYEQQLGARHLLGRKVFAAAAMLGLVAVLAAVVYSIIAPADTNQQVIADRQSISPAVDVAQRTPALAEAAPFSGGLELRTDDPAAVVGFINRTIRENIPCDQWIAADQSDARKPHTLVCSTESFNLLLGELVDIWDKLDSATLTVDTEVFGRKVAVDAVTPEQIADIINQDDSETRIELAKDFALLNNIDQNLPGREVLVVIDNTTVDLITPPRPVLTSNHKRAEKLTSTSGADKNIQLTITVADGS
jgi:uncharacterized membrane protein